MNIKLLEKLKFSLLVTGIIAYAGISDAKEIQVTCSEIADVSPSGDKKLTVRNNAGLAPFESRTYVIDTSKNTVAETGFSGQSVFVFKPSTDFSKEAFIYNFSREESGNRKVVSIDIRTGAYRSTETTVNEDGKPVGSAYEKIGICGIK